MKKNPELLIGCQIKLTDYKEGSVPLEFDDVRVDMRVSAQTILEEDGQVIIPRGMYFPEFRKDNGEVLFRENTDYNRLGGIHVGHAIVEIIK